MKTGLRGRMRLLLPAWVAIVALAAPGAVAADPGNVAPTVTASVSNANPVEPQTVVASATFIDPESDAETYTCSIDYGDGGLFETGVVSGSTCTGPGHRYLVTGSYVAMVFVTDSGGAAGVGMAGVSFVNRAPSVVGLGLVGDHQVGRTAHAVTAVVDNGSDVETYACTSIDYGDGTPLQAGTWVPTGWSDGLPRCVFPDHVYAAIGNYMLTAVATDSGGASGSASFVETIVAQTTPLVIAPADQTVQSAADAFYMGWHDYNLGSFTDPNGAGAGPWTWTVYWGDGDISTATMPSQGALKDGHRYAPGTYRVRVKVQNKAGWWGDAYFNATLIDDGPTVAIANPQVPAEEGLSLTVLNGVWDPAPDCPYAVHIDWGDGAARDFSTCQVGVFDNLTHTYIASDPSSPPNGGPPYTIYNATMTVTDTKGVVGSGTWQVGVEDVAPVVTPNLGIVLAEGQPATQVTLATFTDASVGPWQIYLGHNGGYPLLYETLDAPGPIQI